MFFFFFLFFSCFLFIFVPRHQFPDLLGGPCGEPGRFFYIKNCCFKILLNIYVKHNYDYVEDGCFMMFHVISTIKRSFDGKSKSHKLGHWSFTK